MPKISVIVPVYKAEPYLRRCVDSILAQTFTDFELILVDDGSPDNCGAICDEYAKKDKRIIVLHTENYGPAAARNKALDIERGDYIAFVDADDYVHPGMLEVLVSAAKELDTDIVRFNYAEGELPDFVWSDKDPTFETVSSRHYLRESVLNNKNGIWILCDKFFKKECFKDVRLPEGRFYEDNATVYRLLYKANRIAVTDAVLYYYFQRQGSTTNREFSEKKLDWIIALGEMTDYFADLHDEEVTRSLAGRYLIDASNHYLKAMEVCPQSEKLSAIKEKIKEYYKRYRKGLGLSFRGFLQIYLVLYPNLMSLLVRIYSKRKQIYQMLRR